MTITCSMSSNFWRATWEPFGKKAKIITAFHLLA